MTYNEEKFTEVVFGREDDIESWMEQKRALCIKVRDNVVGVLLISKKHNMICCLAVDPDYRRKGIAAKLMLAALDILDRTKDISVSTFQEDDPKGVAPRTLYKKFGFQEAEFIEEFGYPNQKFILYAESRGEMVED